MVYGEERKDHMPNLGDFLACGLSDSVDMNVSNYFNLRDKRSLAGVTRFMVYLVQECLIHFNTEVLGATRGTCRGEMVFGASPHVEINLRVCEKLLTRFPGCSNTS